MPMRSYNFSSMLQHKCFKMLQVYEAPLVSMDLDLEPRRLLPNQTKRKPAKHQTENTMCFLKHGPKKRHKERSHAPLEQRTPKNNLTKTYQKRQTKSRQTQRNLNFQRIRSPHCRMARGPWRQEDLECTKWPNPGSCFFVFLLSICFLLFRSFLF